MANECTAGSPTGPAAIYLCSDTERNSLGTAIATNLAEEWCRRFQRERPSMRLRIEEWGTIRDGLVAAMLHGASAGVDEGRALAEREAIFGPVVR